MDEYYNSLFVSCAFPALGTDESSLGPDMTVNIDSILEKIPQRKRDIEHKQVSEFGKQAFSQN